MLRQERTFMRFLRQVFLKGLIAVLPVALTIYLVVWLARGFESILGGMIQAVVPEEYYVPGLGVVTGILLVFAVGFMLEAWFTRQLWQLGERLLNRMPLVRAVFGAFKQIVSYLGSGAGPTGSQAVLVSLHGGEARMLGLVTSESLDFLDDPGHEEDIAVLLPWSYQVGGITVFVPRSAVERVNLSAQEALKLVLTGAVGKSATGTGGTA
jgi:uncharacterized membrane protein